MRDSSVITLPVDVLAHTSAKALARTALTRKLHLDVYKFCHYYQGIYHERMYIVELFFYIYKSKLFDFMIKYFIHFSSTPYS